MAKVLLMVENGFEDAEAIYPYYRMQEAGFDVDIVGPSKGTAYHGKHGYPLVAGSEPAAIHIDDYAALIIPGGQAPDRLRANDEMVELVKAAHKAGLVLAAICHGPQMLIEGDLLRGRNATCYKSILTDLLNAGAIYHDLPVIVDGHLITSRRPADLPDFCRQIIALIKADEGGKKNGCC
ncbi:MAG TPA: type 1 glutamine amidotransferase domain-containing protein [Selenomonadales bacterium]|nr:type 1 glutamine amidotransferase domain-containing protein [Selenomonadales bacterium]